MTARPWPKTLLLLDGSAGVVAGVVVLLLSGVIAPFYGLPARFVVSLARMNLMYGACGLSLALAQSRPLRGVMAMALANTVWAFCCVAFAAHLYARATAWGIAHLLLEAIVVATLAAFEWRAYVQARANLLEEARS